MGSEMCSFIVQCFLTMKGEVAVEETERRRSSFLNLRSLEMTRIPQKLCQPSTVLSENVHRIYLQNNRLFHLPDAWGSLLPNTRFLALDNNAFTHLPDSLALMTHLTFLNISHNDFSKLGFPVVICSLKNLRTLWANGVRVQEIPPEINQLKKLEILGLRHNEIRTLPLELWGLKYLIKLFLSDNRLLEIPEHVANLTTLVYLNLDDNLISYLPSPRVFRQLNELRYLSLRDNCLEVTGSVLESLGNIYKLKWCRLDGNSKFKDLAHQYNKGKFKPVRDETVVIEKYDSETVGPSGRLVNDLDPLTPAPQGIPSHTSIERGSAEVIVSQPLMSDRKGHEDNLGDEDLRNDVNRPNTSNRSLNTSQSRVRHWLRSTQDQEDGSDLLNGNGDRAELNVSSSEEEEFYDTNFETEFEGCAEVVGVVEEDEMTRMLVDLEDSDLENSDWSSGINEGVEYDSSASVNTDFTEFAIDTRDLNLIIHRTL